jgi:hypothetical protein
MFPPAFGFGSNPISRRSLRLESLQNKLAEQLGRCRTSSGVFVSMPLKTAAAAQG